MFGSVVSSQGQHSHENTINVTETRGQFKVCKDSDASPRRSCLRSHFHQWITTAGPRPRPRALLGLFNKHFYEIVHGLAGHDTAVPGPVNGPCLMLNDAPSHSYTASSSSLLLPCQLLTHTYQELLESVDICCILPCCSLLHSHMTPPSAFVTTEKKSEYFETCCSLFVSVPPKKT